jgi:hypothetical protein
MTTCNIEARRDNILGIIKSAGSTIFAVEFVKKDGTERTMQIQLPAINKHLVGDAASEGAKAGAQKRRENHPHLLPVFDIANKAIRSINLDSLFAVTVRGTRFDVGRPAGA